MKKRVFLIKLKIAYSIEGRFYTAGECLKTYRGKVKKFYSFHAAYVARKEIVGDSNIDNLEIVEIY